MQKRQLREMVRLEKSGVKDKLARLGRMGVGFRRQQDMGGLAVFEKSLGICVFSV
ncbi:MAG TPA: hypothetical protein VE988_01855 [Gemmataceae bacterium]|nr:hypothetical protein [Gemmataceae bacterium]